MSTHHKKRQSLFPDFALFLLQHRRLVVVIIVVVLCAVVCAVCAVFAIFLIVISVIEVLVVRILWILCLVLFVVVVCSRHNNPPFLLHLRNKCVYPIQYTIRKHKFAVWKSVILFFHTIAFSFIGNAFPYLFDIHFLFCMSRALESCYDIMICTNTFFYAKEFIIQSINFAAIIKYACFT